MGLPLGSEDRPLRVAIIGAGPAGFYAAAALIKNQVPAVLVDIFERLPAPYGLVRYGVAPDHDKIRNVRRKYSKTALDDRVRFFGNVNFGTDLSLDEMRQFYDQVIFTVGAQSDRSLNIAGEDLSGSFSATEFVAWYNGHPDYRHLNPDLSQKTVMVIGAGNVAIDVVRILAQDPEVLAKTDIADHALEALRKSEVTDIHMVIRRGPAQVKFTNPEIKEMVELSYSDVIIHTDDLVLDAASLASLENDRMATKNMKFMTEISEQTLAGKPRRVHFRFLQGPTEIQGENNKVTGITLQYNQLEPTESGYINAVPTPKTETLSADLIFRSVGYRSVPLPGVPFHEKWGLLPNEEGRIMDGETVVSGLYVAGWAKRGPSGVIGTNKADAIATVAKMLADIELTPPAENPNRDAIVTFLTNKNIQFITWEQWLIIDAEEVKRGESAGRPRIKFTTTEEMLTQLT